VLKLLWEHIEPHFRQVGTGLPEPVPEKNWRSPIGDSHHKWNWQNQKNVTQNLGNTWELWEQHKEQ
jgi:hypothetical protein